MDGLTIRSAETLLDTGRTSKEINRLEIAKDAGSVGPVGSIGGPAPTSFSQSLSEAIQNVNQAQKESDRKMQELSTGKSQNIHETMIAAEKADIALRLMVQVRNKIIEAYQEIMRMQV